MLLSICMPSYNRGSKALKHVLEFEELYKKYPEDIEIVVSNNGSIKECEEYLKIKEMSSDHLTYFEFDENQQFVGNLNQVIRLSKAKWALVISDEDEIDVTNFENYLKLLRDNSQVAFVRAGTSFHYVYLESNIFRAGKEAVDGYFLKGNYISGIIYNRDFLSNEVIDALEVRYLKTSRNEAYFNYPHMIIEALLLVAGNICICKDNLIIEGISEAYGDNDEKVDVVFYAGYEERLSQAEGYLELISDIKCSDQLKLLMISIVVQKTFYLVYLVEDKYKSAGFNFNDVLDTIGEELKNMLLISNIPAISRIKSEMLGFVDECRDQYKATGDQYKATEEIGLIDSIGMLIDSYSDDVVDTMILSDVLKKMQTEKDRELKTNAIKMILDSLYYGISRESKAYSYIIMYSFLMWIDPSADTLGRFIDEINIDNSLDYKNIYFLYEQINHLIFINPKCNEGYIRVKVWKLLEKSLQMFISHNSVNLSPVDYSQTKDDLALIITDQFLGFEHGPTKTTLDRAVVLKKRFGKVLIVNTCECAVKEGMVPFYDIATGSFNEQYNGKLVFNWKGTDVNYYQCEHKTPDYEIYVQLLNSIRELNPRVCVCVGGDSLFAGLLSRIFPVMAVGTTQSNLIPSLCTYQIADRHQIELDKELINKLDYSDSIIEGKFTFDVIDTTEEVSRKLFGIPESAFVLSIVGGRVQSEITDELWKVINNVVSENLYVIVIGDYKLPDDFERKYSNISGRVIPMGFCSDAVARIRLSNLYINPHRKGGATSAVEAMMQGIPVVTTNYGDVAGVAEEGFCCKSYKEYPALIERYMNDKTFYEKAQEKARELAAVLLDSETEFNRIIDVYMEKCKGWGK